MLSPSQPWYQHFKEPGLLLLEEGIQRPRSQGCLCSYPVLSLPPPGREQQRVCTESLVHSHSALCILKHHEFPLVPQIKTQYPRVHSSLPALLICNFSNTEKAGSYYLQSTYLFDPSRHESTCRVTNPQPCEKQTYYRTELVYSSVIVSHAVSSQNAVF